MTRSVKSAERTPALLELFSACHEPLTVGQVTRILAIPQASASMLLGSLRALGYLSYDRRRRTYAPTIRVALLGGPAEGRIDRGATLRTGLLALRDRLRLTVFLAVQNDATAQIAHMLAPAGSNPQRDRVGDRRPLSLCAAGHMLLAARFDREVPGWAHRCGAEAWTADPPIPTARLFHAVRLARANGYASTGVDPSFSHGAIAVLLAGAAGLPRVALGVGLTASTPEPTRASIVRELGRVATGRPSPIIDRPSGEIGRDEPHAAMAGRPD